MKIRLSVGSFHLHFSFRVWSLVCIRCDQIWTPQAYCDFGVVERVTVCNTSLIMFGVNFSSNCFINHSRVVCHQFVACSFFSKFGIQANGWLSESSECFISIYTSFCSKWARVRNFGLFIAWVSLCWAIEWVDESSTSTELIKFCGWALKSIFMFWSLPMVTWNVQNHKIELCFSFSTGNHDAYSISGWTEYLAPGNANI